VVQEFRLTDFVLSVALIVQIHLEQNRTDLAIKEAQRARKWAQDSLLVNIAESWVGVREVRNRFQPYFNFPYRDRELMRFDTGW
jgi:hypothetical protein